MSDQRYPLAWPTGWKRAQERIDAKFGRAVKEFNADLGRSVFSHNRTLSIVEAVGRVQHELSALGVEEGEAVISTNLPIRLDGTPKGNVGEPRDPGVACYWTLRNKRECMAIDRYVRVADNIAAIAATLNAMRAIERHGGAEILERAFTGFAQLPETTSGKSWREVLGINGGKVDRTEVITKFKSLLRSRHPDAGGSDSEVHELLWARDQALQEIGQ